MIPEFHQSGEHKFPKQEKLKHRTPIKQLFVRGQSIKLLNIRLIYDVRSSEHPVPRFSVSVPKKNIPRAHDRNKIKRRLREAYRIQKKELMDLCQAKKLGIDMMWIYSSESVQPYAEISSCVSTLLQKLIKKISYSK